MMLFRDFSYAVYTAPGVEEECLCLQDDHGVDVNVLMFCVYVAVVAKIRLSAQDVADIDNEVVGLRDGVILPLRACRRTLKQGVAALQPEEVEQVQQFRERVKEIERAARVP